MVRASVVTLVVACLFVAGLGLATVPGAAHVNHVEADAQHSADGTLQIEWQFVGVDGWVVVRADDGGEPGEPLGYKRVSADDGFQTDTTVSIDESAWADIEGSQDVWVVLHQEEENGDSFAIEDDSMVQTFGEPAGTRLTVEKSDRAAQVLAQGFSPEAVENGTVTVRRAELPTDGFLAVHATDADTSSDVDESNLGPVVGVTSLDAGSHENVTLALDDSYLANSDEQELLFATIYRGDEPFDAETAERLTAGDAAVATTFGAQIRSEDAPTPTPEESDLVSTPPPMDSPTEMETDTDADGTGVGIAGAGVALLMALLAGRRWS